MQAIDVHGHYGTYARDGMPLMNAFMSADELAVIDRACAARTDITVVSPLKALFPRKRGDAVAGNIEAHRIVERHAALRQWVVIDPRRDQTYEQADVMLRKPWCVGIKIHPEEHDYSICAYGDAIFKFAAARNAVILTHSGEANSLPLDFVPFADAYPEAAVILAHLGHGPDNDPTHQVRAIQSARQRNMYTDTSSAKSIGAGLIEWAVSEIGADRILYGSDTPLYFAAAQRARIDHAEIDAASKQMILSTNAQRLLALQQESAACQG